MDICIAILEIDRLLLAGPLPALERHVDELGNVGVGRDPGKSATAQDGGFERELRRDADAHLLLARHLAGLVVENGIASVRELLDAVGAGAQREHALLERDFDPPGGFGGKRRSLASALAVPSGKPAGDALESRPPERARFRVV